MILPPQIAYCVSMQAQGHEAKKVKIGKPTEETKVWLVRYATDWDRIGAYERHIVPASAINNARHFLDKKILDPFYVFIKSHLQ